MRGIPTRDSSDFCRTNSGLTFETLTRELVTPPPHTHTDRVSSKIAIVLLVRGLVKTFSWPRSQDGGQTPIHLQGNCKSVSGGEALITPDAGLLAGLL